MVCPPRKDSPTVNPAENHRTASYLRCGSLHRPRLEPENLVRSRIRIFAARCYYAACFIPQPLRSGIDFTHFLSHSASDRNPLSSRNSHPAASDPASFSGNLAVGAAQAPPPVALPMNCGLLGGKRYMPFPPLATPFFYGQGLLAPATIGPPRPRFAKYLQIQRCPRWTSILIILKSTEP